MTDANVNFFPKKTRQVLQCTSSFQRLATCAPMSRVNNINPIHTYRKRLQDWKIFKPFLLVIIAVLPCYVSVTRNFSLISDLLKSRFVTFIVTKGLSERVERENSGILIIAEKHIRAIHRFQRLSGDSRHISGNERNISFDFVMHDLASRILSRDRDPNPTVIIMHSGNSSVASHFYSKAIQRLYDVYEINVECNQSNTLDQWFLSTVNRPKSILCLILDHEYDAFSSRNAASTFLSNGPKMTYIIFTVSITLQTLNTSQYNYRYTSSGKLRIQDFLDQNYKVQLLSVSDLWSISAISKTHEPGIFLPNSLITSDNIDIFFAWAAYSAALSRTLASINLKPPRLSRSKNFVFKAFLFATHGLDLAIPSRREYLLDSKYSKRVWPFPYNNREEEIRAMVDYVTFKPCPKFDVLEIKFRAINHHHIEKPNSNFLRSIDIYCNGSIISSDIFSKIQSNRSVFWMSSNREAACVKLNCQEFLNSYSSRAYANPLEKSALSQIACTSRILPTKDDKAIIHTERKPNILLVLIDPISRAQFDFIMPETSTFSQKASDFIRFDLYTTVGNDSDMNQMALFAGATALNQSELLWNKLRTAGYVTFAAENTCVSDSFMMRSRISNATNHGYDLQKLFCFHFARPNCVGSHLAAHYLINHTQQFIQAYSRNDQPWAALISFVDTHEDTLTLGKLIDKMLKNFLEEESSANETAIVLLSTHGIDYGPYFTSKVGKKDRSQPVFLIQIPNKMDVEQSNLIRNSNKWITPFDIHKTILQIAGISLNERSFGLSLLDALPKSRNSCRQVNEIPDSHCSLVETISFQTSAEHEMPPSLLSFFADIPRDHRWKRLGCTSSNTNIINALKNITHQGDFCNCSTSHREWFSCNTHPWNSTSSSPHEFFIIIKCPHNPIHFETRIVKEERHVLHYELIQRSRNDTEEPPSIMIIEVDSVSIEHARRHLPQSRKWINSLRAGNDGKCHSAFCSVNLPKFTLSGPNSISNQVASLSGCVTTLRHDSCFKPEEEIEGNNKVISEGVCTDPATYEFDLQLRSNGPNQHTVFCPVEDSKPLLYDVAKDNGYLTFFGEEFCYPGSPWVFQNNVFELKADIHLHEVYCRMLKLQYPNSSDHYLLNLRGVCFDDGLGMDRQNIGINILQKMWDAYPNVPKFAYLNSIAAHEYTNDTAKIPLAIEEFDASLSKFLKKFLNHSSAKNTIILVRSDHGLQGGNAATVDYSTQLEHRRPWNTIVVPKRFYTRNLHINSGKAITPYDLYATLKELITMKKYEHRPAWQFNILHDEIPSSTMCKKRKIPLDFCPSIEVPYPNFGVCNPFEEKQAIFCRDPYWGAKINSQ
jgi:hypothetical protein